MTPEERKEKTKNIVMALLREETIATTLKRLESEIINPAIEEEREACAEIVDKELGDVRAFRDHCRSKGMLDGEAMSFAKVSALTEIARKIRARKTTDAPPDNSGADSAP